nr:hypothetical protein [uncultured Marinifilum sp.]
MVVSGYSQYFDTGQDPASIKWKQINTSNFQIIFPQESEHKARYVAAIFEDLLNKGGKNLGHKPKKFSLIMHTHSATSNGMVAWAPKRMEMFTTSSQDNNAQLWLYHLATHEYRHIVQLDKIEQGFTRVLNCIFGQQATAVVVGLYIPPWFLEGDAVCTETSLSESGRGRMPEFEQQLRAQLLEKGRYCYDKAVNGSYKDFITDRYKLGYYLVGKARTNYGDKVWDNAINKTAKKPYGITSFADGIKEVLETKRDSVYELLYEKQKTLMQLGIKVEEIDWEMVKEKNSYSDGKLMLYFDTMEDLLMEWKIKDATTSKSEFIPISKRCDYYTNKRFPKQTEAGDIIYLKYGLSDGLCFEKQKIDGSAKQIFIPGNLSNIAYDYCKGKLVWAESKEDIRWEKADKSILVCYDIINEKRKVICNDNSLFAPSFNANGEQIAAIESDKKGDNKLVVINTSSGLISKKIIAGEKEYFQNPKFIDDNNIVLIVLNEKGKHLVKINLESKEKNILFSSAFADMSYPVVAENMLYFNATFTGIDNLFAYDLKTGKIFQVTSSKFGARDAFVAKDSRIYYSDYSSDGYLLVSAKIDSSKWKQFKAEYYKYPLAEKLSEQLGEKLKPDTTNLNRYQVKNYSKLTHLFNFHSWAPVFIDGIDAEADIGISFASQNKLSSLMTTVGYRREEGFDNGQFYVNLSYRGWFPIIDSKLTLGNKSSEYASLAERISPQQTDTVLVNTDWRQWEWENSISLPFNISAGQYSRKIIPKITYNIARFANLNTTALATTQSNTLGLGEYNFDDQSFTQEIMEYQLFAYNIAKMAPRDVQYQWAQIAEFNYRNTPFGDRELGNTWSAEGYLYFPGLVKHHGFKLYGGYQYRSLINSRFSNSIKSPRGMLNLYGKHIVTAGADYALPLFYPDWNLGPLAYFKRVKLNTFVDFGYQQRSFESDEGIFQINDNYLSGGVELRTDLHALRFSAPVDVGVRIGYENQSNSMFADFLISFSLSSY